MSSRYVYGEQDLSIADCQCDFCLYKTENKTKCQKYEQIPLEILNNSVGCKTFKDANEISLE